MIMSDKITIGITTYNSAEWVIKQLQLDYFTHLTGIVNEIVIQDDCSSDYNTLKKFETNNIKIFTNKKNLSPLLNRKELVQNCTNEWVWLLDSDNSIQFTSQNGTSLIDILNSFDFSITDTIYAPCFVNHYGYKNLIDKKIDLYFAAANLNDPSFYLKIALNTGNYLVPRTRYLDICKDINNLYAHYVGDVLYFNYLWLKNENFICFKKDFEYEHVIRDDGYTIMNYSRSLLKLDEIYQLYLNS